MIWLISYPRSGNTFFRNILYDVYGIESSAFYIQDNNTLRCKDYYKYAVVKSHHLPSEVPLTDDCKVIYLVRDGRDAMVSSAHYKKDIDHPDTHYHQNLLGVSATKSLEGFGGWSDNVEAWLPRADLVVKFEDLITKPLNEVEKLRALMDLPSPNAKKLPTFRGQQSGNAKYRAGKNYQKFFRRGKVGAWKDEMPKDIQKIFWKLHGDTMLKLGYQKTAGMNSIEKILFDIGNKKRNVFTAIKRIKYSKLW